MSDCVDREAVKALLYENPLENEDVEIGEYQEIYNGAIEDVLALPSVEPERPVGHWKLHGLGYICPICRIETSEANVKAGLMNFCPNCGAKMENVE